MKKSYSQDFINVYSDVAPEGFCQHSIEQFDRLVSAGSGWSRLPEGAPGHIKHDYAVGLNYTHTTADDFNDVPVTDVFFNALTECMDDYREQFSVIQNMNVQANHVKMQRTDPGGGYHVWHGERMDFHESTRVFTYMMYLNTLDDDAAGETEFLYQQKRFKAIENTMVVWPSEWTHAHRGNLVHGTKSKYIITGWFYFV